MTLLHRFFPKLQHNVWYESNLREFFLIFKRYSDLENQKNNFFPDQFSFLDGRLPGGDEVFGKITSNQGDVRLYFSIAENFDADTYLLLGHSSAQTCIEGALINKLDGVTYPLYIAFFKQNGYFVKESSSVIAYIDVYALNLSTGQYEQKKRILPVSHITNGSPTNNYIFYILFKIESSDVNYGEYTYLSLSQNLKGVYENIYWLTNSEVINNNVASIAFTRKNNNFNLNLKRTYRPFIAVPSTYNYPFLGKGMYVYDFFANGNGDIKQDFVLRASGTIKNTIGSISAPLLSYVKFYSSFSPPNSITNSFNRYNRGVKKVEILQTGTKEETFEGTFTLENEYYTNCDNENKLWRRTTTSYKGTTYLKVKYFDSEDDFTIKEKDITPTSKILLHSQNNNYIYKVIFDVNEENLVHSLSLFRKYTEGFFTKEDFAVCGREANFESGPLQDYFGGVTTIGPSIVENNIIFASQEHIIGTQNACPARLNYLHTNYEYLPFPRWYPMDESFYNNFQKIDFVDENTVFPPSTNNKLIFIKKVDDQYIYGEDFTNSTNTLTLSTTANVDDPLIVDNYRLQYFIHYYCDSENFYANCNLKFPQNNNKLKKYTFLELVNLLKNKQSSYNFAPILYKNVPIFIKVFGGNDYDFNTYIPGMYFEWNEFFQFLEDNNINPSNTKQVLNFITSIIRKQSNSSELMPGNTYIMFTRTLNGSFNSIYFSHFFPVDFRKRRDYHNYNTVKYRTYNYKPLT